MISKRKEKLPMSEMLLSLFDYQRFEGDPLLKSLIDKVEGEYGSEIPDDDIFRVSAAGEEKPNEKRKKSQDGRV